MRSPDSAKPATILSGELAPKSDKLAGVVGFEAKPQTPQTQGANWRDHLAIHPAAELLPLLSELSDADLRELADDIEQNGLLEKVSVIVEDGVPRLLDGRNQLDALQLLGREIFVSKYNSDAIDLNGIKYRKTHKKLAELAATDSDRCSLSREIFEIASAIDVEDPYAYVLSKNVHRRHLTAERKRGLIADLLKARPETSNRQIAKELNDDHKKVGRVREKLESTGALPQLDKTTGKDGKKRPAKKRLDRYRTKPEPNSVTAESARALAEFSFACRTYLPRMTTDDLIKALELATEFTNVKPKAA